MLKFSMPFLRMSLQEFEGDDIYIFFTSFSQPRRDNYKCCRLISPKSVNKVAPSKHTVNCLQLKYQSMALAVPRWLSFPGNAQKIIKCQLHWIKMSGNYITVSVCLNMPTILTQQHWLNQRLNQFNSHKLIQTLITLISLAFSK